MEGWDDEEWGALEDTCVQEMSSGADFFDTFQSKAPSSTGFKGKEEEFFETFAILSTSRGSRERNQPPPVSSALFGGGEHGSRDGEVGESGWGDWGSDFTDVPSHQVEE